MKENEAAVLPNPVVTHQVKDLIVAMQNAMYVLCNKPDVVIFMGSPPVSMRDALGYSIEELETFYNNIVSGTYGIFSTHTKEEVLDTLRAIIAFKKFGKDTEEKTNGRN